MGKIGVTLTLAAVFGVLATYRVITVMKSQISETLEQHIGIRLPESASSPRSFGLFTPEYKDGYLIGFLVSEIKAESNSMLVNGDLIVAVDGVKIKGLPIEEGLKYIWLLTSGKNKHLTIMREGKQLALLSRIDVL